jgi:LPXTG-motif cell wall-anchored protein
VEKPPVQQLPTIQPPVVPVATTPQPANENVQTSTPKQSNTQVTNKPKESLPKTQNGGKMPKTASDAPVETIAGVLLLALGGFFLSKKRRNYA